ncbi:MAG: hypothetical protein GQ535_10910 [Rhodobacteraceae bacterium]|nr:hypothetical protein [Paracoccaceae bacterium]
MPFRKPAYPATLTDKHWQKKKGSVAKIAGKTGIGSALKETAKAFDKVDWEMLDVGKRLPIGVAGTIPVLDKIFAEAVAEYKTSIDGTLRKKIQDVKKLADDTAAKWAKKKGIPKSSTKAAQDLAKDADFFMVAMNKNSLLQLIAKEYKENLKGLKVKEKIYADSIKRLHATLAKIVKASKTVTTTSEYAALWSEEVRGVGTIMPLISKQKDLIPEHKAWRVFSSQGFQPKTDEEIPEKFAAMMPVMKKILMATR